ncbi:TetR/AcrR family transcriptional regulator [Pseudonocardia aurantiaca]
MLGSQYGCTVTGVPKQVDHAERRALIADAVLAVIARSGLEEASVRHVAAEAGVSVGMVQHYFRSKDEMMRFALERISAGVEERLSGVGELSARAMLRALFLQLLPLDEQRTREGRVALEFISYATVRPELGGELRDNARALREYFAAQIDGGPLAPEPAATGLLAMLEGLGVQVLSGQLAPDDAVAAFDAYLGVVFGPAE